MRSGFDVELLIAITQLAQEEGVVPTYRDLAGHLHVGTTMIYTWIKKLEQRGMIRHPRGAVRAITITPAGYHHIRRHAQEPYGHPASTL